MQNVHKRIRKAREEKGLTQADMAIALEISQPGYQQMESGKRPDMRISTLKKLCKELNISADWLLGLEKPKEGRSAKMSKLDEFYEKVMEIIAHAEDNQFITEEAATILRQNISEAKDELE